LKGLASKKNIEITIIDSRDYFEYTPGILRTFVQPHYIKNLTAELKILEELGNNVTFLHAEATSINDGEVVVRRCQGDRETCVSFDYLVVATGSRYPSCQVVKPSTHETTLDSRILSLQNMHCEIESAHSVLIIGAGPVGVELAAELLTQFPNKHVKIVDMQPKVCASLSDKATQYITRWFSGFPNCELILGKGIAGTWPNLMIDSGGCNLVCGTRVDADLVLSCMGMLPHTPAGPSAGTPGVDPEASAWGVHLPRDRRGALTVNDFLQVTGHTNIFAVGDCMVHKRSAELKLGHTAEVNGHLVSANIARLLEGKPLLPYPDGVTGASTTPRLYAISLGKYDGVVAFNWLTFGGPLAALMKWVLEWTKVRWVTNTFVGYWFWTIADVTSMFLGRTILRN